MLLRLGLPAWSACVILLEYSSKTGTRRSLHHMTTPQSEETIQQINDIVEQLGLDYDTYESTMIQIVDIINRKLENHNIED